MRPTTQPSHHDDRHPVGPGEFPAPRTECSDVEERRRSSWEKLNQGAVVQQSLLPDLSESVGGYGLASVYLPCEELAGDFYDIFCDSDRTTLMVADAMGHGAEAALVTMLLKAVFHETAPHIGETDALLSKMNERLLRLIPEGSFAATTVARLDPENSVVELSNAGLPYPFVLRASTRSVDEVMLGGVPLGLNVNGGFQEYDTCKVKLAPGDVLLIASDGIGSIEGDDGQCFEDLRLPRALSRLAGFSGEMVIESLVADALEFSNGRPFPDDVNLIAVWRDDPPGKH